MRLSRWGWATDMSTKATKHSAPGPYLGYGLQTVRLCARLLNEPPDSTVFVEHDDDVSVLYSDGTKLLEQTKRVKSNPLSDWSVDLWKTVHNWLEDHAPFDVVSKLCLYITPDHEPGEFARALAKASSAQDVAELVTRIKSQLTSAKKKSKVYPFVSRFLSAEPDEQLSLAARFEIVREGDPFSTIRLRYEAAVSPLLLERIISFALGEAKVKSDRLLEMGKPAAINAGEFKDTVRRFVQEINLPAYFDFDSPPIDPAEIDIEFVSRPTFVRQLELIEASKQQQLQAINDYLRAISSKTRWGEEGILLPGSLDEWESGLLQRHSAICDSFEVLHSSLNDVSRGKAVYAECRRLELSLQGKSVPGHFTHGCFNELSGTMKLGWHPDYLSLLE